VYAPIPTDTTVSLGKIAKKLKREFKANPAKAALLGVATLVALYFWVPLVWGWIGQGKTNMVTAASTTGLTPTSQIAQPTSASTTSPGSTTKNTSNRPSWMQIAHWMENDPRTLTAPPMMTKRDPFEPVANEVEPQVDQAEQAKQNLAAITPKSAGLVLTSTIIGPQRRVARINGKTYAVGQTIEVSPELSSLGVAFKLIDVQARLAVLEIEGRQYDLEIPEPSKSNKMELIEATEK
jgi:hypothetical protein